MSEPGAPPPAPRISLCMIVKDEAERLGVCLASVRPWVDELVVLDTGSRDRTTAIAQAAGARVIDWPWRDDFSAARNESLAHATGDWIFYLDADELLLEGSGPALRSACTEAPADVCAYTVKRRNALPGDGVMYDSPIRIFRRLPGVRFKGRLDDQILPSLVGRGRIEPSGVELLHEGLRLSPEHLEQKMARNRRLLELETRDDPADPLAWFHLAPLHRELGRHDEAIDAYRRFLLLNASARIRLDTDDVVVALLGLAASLFARGDRAEGARMLQTALELAATIPVPSEPWRSYVQAFSLCRELARTDPAAQAILTGAVRDEVPASHAMP